MSRFFASTEDEREEGRRPAVREKVYTTADKQNKKEKRLNELQHRVMELEEEDNQKLFDKQLKKLFADVRKAENCFGDGIPAFLKRFLTSPRVYGGTHRHAIDELLLRYEPRVDEPAFEDNKKDEEAVCKDLENILVIKDVTQRRNELLTFKDSVDNNTMKVKALMTLLSIYTKSSDGRSMMKTIDELVDCFEMGGDVGMMKKTFMENIDFYLGVVYEDPGLNLQMYGELLDKLSSIGRHVVERRLLQVKFFKLNQTPKTEHLLFKLIYICRTFSYDEARRYYGKIKEDIGRGKMDLEILQEFGLHAFSNGDFEKSFEALSISSRNLQEEVDLKIKLLCVILNDKVRASSIYKEFLESFRNFGKNKFCFPSGNDVLEIYRSFYLLNMYDSRGAGNIIRRYCGNFDESIWLADFIRSRLIKDT